MFVKGPFLELHLILLHIQRNCDGRIRYLSISFMQNMHMFQFCVIFMHMENLGPKFDAS